MDRCCSLYFCLNSAEDDNRSISRGTSFSLTIRIPAFLLLLRFRASELWKESSAPTEESPARGGFSVICRDFTGVASDSECGSNVISDLASFRPSKVDLFFANLLASGGRGDAAGFLGATIYFGTGGASRAGGEGSNGSSSLFCERISSRIFCGASAHSSDRISAWGSSVPPWE